MGRRAVAGLVGVVVALAVAVLVFQSALWVDVVGVGEYDRGTVTVTDSGQPTPCTAPPDSTAVAACDGARTLATVDVRIADTQSQRYTGLSDTESLGTDEGMLFVHESAGEYAYVMRDMDFPLDIIFVATDGTITTIHHAPLPPEGTGDAALTRYEGRGKYVLEVNRGWTNRTGVGVGDRVELPDSAV